MTASSAAGPSIDWTARLAPYGRPDHRRSLGQLINTTVPFVGLWAAMLWSLEVGYWLTLLLAVPAGLLVVRMFMFQHDCGHASFFASQRANRMVGSVIGVLTLVPYAYWRRTHAIHHATSGNLDARGFGDIETITVREYLDRSWFGRLLYRLYRNPLVLLLLGPFYQFVLKHRYPADCPRSWKKGWASVHWTNAALGAVLAVAWATIGIDRFLLVHGPIVLLSGSIGVFLFYVQHQYEDTYWRHQQEWDYYASGLEGASHLVMPKVLQWFTGSIGLHHIHHVASRIPNYRLQECFDEVPEIQNVTRLTLLEGVKTLRLTLWDEEGRSLVGFGDLPAIVRRDALELAEGQATGSASSSTTEAVAFQTGRQPARRRRESSSRTG